MRTFFAIELDNSTRRLLQGIQDKLREEGVTGNYSFTENLHLTVKFLGEVNTQQLTQARELLQKVAEKQKPFVLSLHSLGKFSKGNKLILWAGLKKENLLFSLNREVEQGLKAFLPGIEEKGYSPHITLVREAVSTRPFEKLNVLKDERGYSFCAQGLSLMESTRVEGRLAYIRQAFVPFAAE